MIEWMVGAPVSAEGSLVWMAPDWVIMLAAIAAARELPRDDERQLAISAWDGLPVQRRRTCRPPRVITSLRLDA